MHDKEENTNCTLEVMGLGSFESGVMEVCKDKMTQVGLEQCSRMYHSYG